MKDTLSTRRRRHIYIDSKLDELPLTMEAFRVYCHLVRRADNEYRKAFPSYRTISESCFRGSFPDSPIKSLRQKAIAAIKELVNWNLLIKEETYRADGSQSSNNYIITDISEWHDAPSELSELIRKRGIARRSKKQELPPNQLSEDTPPSIPRIPLLVFPEYPPQYSPNTG